MNQKYIKVITGRFAGDVFKVLEENAKSVKVALNEAGATLILQRSSPNKINYFEFVDPPAVSK